MVQRGASPFRVSNRIAVRRVENGLSPSFCRPAHRKQDLVRILGQAAAQRIFPLGAAPQLIGPPSILAALEIFPGPCRKPPIRNAGPWS